MKKGVGVWSAETIRRTPSSRRQTRERFFLVGRQRGGGKGLEGVQRNESGELPGRSLSAHWRITNERAFKEIFCVFYFVRGVDDIEGELCSTGKKGMKESQLNRAMS